MNSFLRFSLATVATLTLATLAFAGDPTGTWSFQVTGRGGQTMTSTVDLVLKNGVLSGTAHGLRGSTPITEASFTDEVVAFTVVRQFDGKNFAIKYSGHLEMDSIKGSIVSPARDGGTRTVAWEATRPPAAPAPKS